MRETPTFPESSDVPSLIHGDALDVLRRFPDESVDCVLTSPPYWKHRKYRGGGIGQEPSVDRYVDSLLEVFREVKRALRRRGSFWLNMGDTYHRKALVGVPWRTALAMSDRQGWVLRNEVVWNKVKGGPDNTTDRLRGVHEQVFHFVRVRRGYYYDVDAVRARPRASKVVKGAVVSATGVTGVRYRRQIELSTALSAEEKSAALAALEQKLDEVSRGALSDFRMVIRGQQRTTHSDRESVSGRARELRERGFYFLRYHPSGAKPADVWDIIPEDSQRRRRHFSPFPEDLCRVPILATCPEGGIVLDPFCGTGTTCLVAAQLGRRSIGIDLSSDYLEIAAERVKKITT